MNLYKKLWKTLNRIQQTLGMGPTQMSELLSLSKSEYLTLKSKMGVIPARCLYDFCEALNFDYEALMSGTIDYRVMAQQFLGNEGFIPERYLRVAYTKKRVASNLLDYVEAHYGWDKRVSIMRCLQITEGSLANSDELVNLQLTTDILNWIYRYYKTDSSIENLGKKLLFSKRNSHLFSEVKDVRSVFELFEKFFGGLLSKYLEQNFSWNIHKMSPSLVVIRGYPNQDLFTLNEDILKSKVGILVRKGILSSVPLLIGLDFAPIKITQDLSTGSYFEMEIDIESLLKSKGNIKTPLSSLCSLYTAAERDF